MDRNQLISISLLALLATLYIQRLSNKPAALPPIARVEQAIPSVVDPATYGPFAKALQGERKTYTLENECLKVTFSSQGARPVQVVLKKHQDHQQESIQLMREEDTMYWKLPYGDTTIDTRKLFFTAEAPVHQEVKDAGSAAITFVAQTGEGQYLQHTFRLAAKSHQLEFLPQAVGYGQVMPGIATLCSTLAANQLEKNRKDGLQKLALTYLPAGKKFAQLKGGSAKMKQADLGEPVQWVALKQRFFTTGLAAAQPFVGARLSWVPQESASQQLGKASWELQVPMPQLAKEPAFTYYFGPNEYTLLKQVAPQFDRNLTLGWLPVRWLNLHVTMPFVKWLQQYIHHPALLIFLLALLIRLLLLPLAYRSQKAMAKMQAIKPALDELKAKHGGNTQALQMEQMALYRKMGINPLSGCMPVLLQAPVLITMFNFFQNTIALRQVGLWWATDLSTYDSIFQLPFSIPGYGDHVSLFALLMTLSTLAYTWSSGQLQNVDGPMKPFTYLMPCFFLVIFNSFPAALSFFYLITNVLTFAQQEWMKRLMNRKALVAEATTYAEQPQPGAKKPRAQARLEKSLNKNKKR